MTSNTMMDELFASSPTFVRSSTDVVLPTPAAAAPPLKSLLQLVVEAGGALGKVPQREVGLPSTQLSISSDEDSEAASAAAERDGQPFTAALTTRTTWRPSDDTMDHYFQPEWTQCFLAAHGIRGSCGSKLAFGSWRSGAEGQGAAPPPLLTLRGVRLPPVVEQMVSRKLQEGSVEPHRHHSLPLKSYEAERHEAFELEHLASLVSAGSTATPPSAPSTVLKGVQHLGLPSVLLGEHTLLHGPPSSGKQVCATLGLLCNLLGLRELPEEEEDGKAEEQRPPVGLLVAPAFASLIEVMRWASDVFGEEAFAFYVLERGTGAMIPFHLRRGGAGRRDEEQQRPVLPYPAAPVEQSALFSEPQQQQVTPTQPSSTSAAELTRKRHRSSSTTTSHSRDRCRDREEGTSRRHRDRSRDRDRDDGSSRRHRSRDRHEGREEGGSRRHRDRSRDRDEKDSSRCGVLQQEELLSAQPTVTIPAASSAQQPETPLTITPSYLTRRLPLLFVLYRDLADLAEQEGKENHHHHWWLRLRLEHVRHCTLLHLDRALRAPLSSRLLPMHWSALISALDVSCQVTATTRYPLHEVFEFMRDTLLSDAASPLWVWSQEDQSVWHFVRCSVETVRVEVAAPATGARDSEDTGRITGRDIDLSKIQRMARLIELQLATSSSSDSHSIITVLCTTRRDHQVVCTELRERLSHLSCTVEGEVRDLPVLASAPMVLVLCDAQLESVESLPGRGIPFHISHVMVFSVPMGVMMDRETDAELVLVELMSRRLRVVLGKGIQRLLDGSAAGETTSDEWRERVPVTLFFTDRQSQSRVGRRAEELVCS